MTRAWDPREDAWFAGLTDGEGCFGLYARGRRQQRTAETAPRFAISLRADDMEILEVLHAHFGGVVKYRQSAKGPLPQCDWTVTSKRELAGLLVYFDRFPLRAKKARDYAIWRRGVEIYCAHGGADERLILLRETLMAGRAFRADMPDPVAPVVVQTALGIGDRP